MRQPTEVVSVVIPAFNEEQAVAHEVKTIVQVLRSRGIGHEVHRC